MTGGAGATVALPPATRTGDAEFAWRLYAEAMEPLCAAYSPWLAAEQRARFDALYRPEETSIVMRDGAPVGGLAAREGAAEIALLQFFLAPEHRRRGLGSTILLTLLEAWDRSGRPVTLGVLKNNPARSLYERLGFEAGGESGIKLVMRRPAGQDPGRSGEAT